jgi:hypothetical protein
MRSFAAAVLALLLFASSVRAEVDPFQYPTTGKSLLETILAAPARNLAEAQVLRGKFVHEKHLSEIPQPLKSEGEFTYVRGLGVHWHTKRPFDSEFVLTQEGILQRDEGTETLRLSAQEQPAVRVIAEIFLALFTLDVTSLNASFDLYGRSQGERWIVGLRPRTETIGSVFKEATIKGAKDVEQVVLSDAHGDRTVIQLQDIRYSATEPDASVRALFAQ